MIPQWLSGGAKQSPTKNPKFPRRPRGKAYQPLVELLEDRLAPANITSFQINPDSGFPFNTPTPITVGNSITINTGWTASSGGTVNIRIDNNSPFITGSFPNGGGWTWTTPPTTVPPQGQHTVTQTVTDNSGTDTATRTIIVYSDYNVGVSVSANPSVYGQSITITADANAVSAGATASFAGGRMEIYLDGGLVASGSPNAAGVLTYSVNGLAPGSHQYQAIYYGDNINYARGFVLAGATYVVTNPLAQSGISSFTVNAAPTTTTLASSSNPSTPGQNVTFTATVAANSPSTFTPTGTVDFFLDGSATPIASNVAMVNGVATWSSNSLTLGNHTVFARYDGNTNFVTSTSNTITQAVRTGTTTTIVSSLNPAFAGQQVTFTAVVVGFDPNGSVPTGTVTFFDGATSLGVAPLQGGAATFTTSTLATGARNITATYAPGNDPRFNASTSATFVETVVETPVSVALSASSTSNVVGQPLALTAVVSSLVPVNPIPGGTIQFQDNGVNIGSAQTLAGGTVSYVLTGAQASVGNHQFTAVYTATAAAAGNDFANATSAPVIATIGKADTTTTLSAAPNPANLGASVTLTATVASLLPGTGVPGGSVIFYNNGVSLGSGTLNASGVATLAVTNLPGGTLSLTATYTGSSTYNGSSAAAVTQVVNPRATTTAVTSSNLNAVAGAGVTFTATVSATGGTVSGLPLTSTVTFYDGSTALGTVNLTGTTAVFTTNTLSVGSHAITAVYAGNASYDGSTSGAITQVIGTVGTTTVVASSNLNAASGANVTFTATVSAVGGVVAGLPLTGTVTFFDGATMLGSAAVSGGTATLNTNTLTLGTHPITATYSGNTTYNTSTSAVINQVVGTVSTTTVVASSSLSAVEGATVTFTATISPATSVAGLPLSGAVTFMDGTTALGTGNVNAAGVATLNTNTLIVGNHPITAVYDGNTTYAGSTSAVINQVITVAPVSTSLFLESSVNPSMFGQTVTFTATVVAANGDIPFGSVTFYNDTNPGSPVAIGTATLTGGKASVSVSTLTVAANTPIRAVYAAAGKYLTSSATLNQTVQAAGTTTSLSASTTAANIGDTVTFTAHVSVTSPGVGTPTGTVQFGFTGPSTFIGLGTVNSSGDATYTTSALLLGTYTVTATYNPSPANFATSSSSPVQVTVSKATPAAAVSSSVNPAIVGNNVTLSATITPTSSTATSPTGTVTFYDGTTAIATQTIAGGGTGAVTVSTTTNSLTIGSHPITAVYSGDSNYNTVTSEPFTQTIKGAATTTTLTSTPASPTNPGQSITLNAQAVYSGPLGQQPASALSGTITFKEGSTVLGTVTVDTTGKASFAVSAPTTGSHAYTAVYSGDALYETSTGALTHTVAKGNSAITLATSTTAAVVNRPVTFTATVSAVSPATGTPTGTVTFYEDVNGVLTALGTGTIKNGTATFTTSTLTKGTHKITAKYNGDDNFNPSQVATGSEVTQFVTSVPLIFTR